MALSTSKAGNSKTDKVSFLHVFDSESSYPIFSRVCDFLSIGEIVSLTRTCKSLANVYQLLLALQWNINRELRRFVRDPQGFRGQIGKSDALISGSFALQFFERLSWMNSDLDIFVRLGEKADVLCQYMITVEGYVCDVVKPNEDYIRSDIQEVWTLKMKDHRSARERKVQLIITKGPPVQAILQGFYTTIVINFLSWNKAYAIFPKTTFIEYKGYMLRSERDFEKALASKYERRGWAYEEVAWPQKSTSKYKIRSPRRVGDRYSWQISLDISKVERSSTPDFVLDHAEFGLKVPRDDRDFDRYAREDIRHYPISVSAFKPWILRYEYPCAPDGWTTFLARKMDQYTIIELLKLDPEERPHFAAYEELIDNFAGVHLRIEDVDGFERPRNWTYYDDKIPELYDEWENGQSAGT